MLLSVSKMLGEGMAMAEKMLEKVAAGELSLAELEEKVRQDCTSDYRERRVQKKLRPSVLVIVCSSTPT